MQQSCPLVLVPCSVLVLACVSIISPLHPLTKVVNLLLSTLMKAVVEGGVCWMQCPSTTWQCSFLPHPLYPSYPLNTSWETPYHLHNGGETYLCQEPEFLATQSTPLSPILTIPSVCGIEYTYPYISRHNKERTFPSNNAKSKPSYKNLHYLVGSCTPVVNMGYTMYCAFVCIYTYI